MITGMPRIAMATADFDGIVSIFREQFGLPVVDVSDTSVDDLGAKLGLCVPPGGSNIELMSPADPNTPLSQSLERFLAKRGQGLFALMLEAPVPDDEAERLLANGLNVLPLMEGAGGRDIHPNSTGGVLIRVYPENSFHHEQKETNATLGLSGIGRVEIASTNLDTAVEIWGHKLGLDTDDMLVDETRGVKSVIVRPPTGGVIELVAVNDPAKPYARRLNKFLNAHGQGMFRIVLESNDPESTARKLAERHLQLTPNDESFDIDVNQTYGAQIAIAAKRDLREQS